MSVESYFQQRAEQFDALYALESPWQRWWNRHFRAGLYERAALSAQEIASLGECSVLDVGCGSGRNSLLFAQGGARRVTGIDFSAPMIELAKSMADASAHRVVLDFICADFLEHRFSARFDAVVALGVFDYFKDPVPALRKMASLANKKVIASFPGGSWPRAPFRKLRYALRGCPVYFYSRAKLKEFLDRAGLPDHKILDYSSSGFLVVATPSGASEGRAV